TVTKYVPVEAVRTEYREADTAAIINRFLKIFESRKEREVKNDSLVDRTKETVVLNERGDTTRHDKERTVYKSTQREKELETENKTLRDSISSLNTRLESVKTDSVPVPYPVVKDLTFWEKGGYYATGAGVGVGVTVLSVVIIWIARRCRRK
ncbi:MAG: hypothetical protein K2H18_02560, partial [Muribaculaceae bacterium]|nr:hypothetical protein [Muribaculaceae bacterium]